jgi:endonuclease YncB( thermonuclease family)
MRARLLILAAWLACAWSGAHAGEWTRLEGCRLLENVSNDGDSFHIKHQGREYIIRLYFVDCPETRDHRELVERTTDQAKYWNIYKKDLFVLADRAVALAAAALDKRFTVDTKWEDAQGASRLPRYYGLITLEDGRDFGRVLVAAGLARIYGVKTDMPNGAKNKAYLEKLDETEAGAKEAKLGAWALTKPPKQKK